MSEYHFLKYMDETQKQNIDPSFLRERGDQEHFLKTTTQSINHYNSLIDSVVSTPQKICPSVTITFQTEKVVSNGHLFLKLSSTS